MKKKILLVLTFILSFLIFTDKAFAARLDLTNYTLECIYEDGGLYTEEWSVGKERLIDSRTTYNLVGASKSDSNKGGSSVFVNKLGRTLTTNQQGEKETTYCASKLYSADLTGDDNVSKSFYKFDSRLSCEADDCPDFELNQGGWCRFWGCAGETKKGMDAAENQKNYKLVSERYLLSDDYPEPNKTLYYVMPAEQKIGTAAYVRIYIYDNIALLVKDGRATRIDDSEKSIAEKEPDTLYLNSPEPTPVSDSSSIINYKFNNSQVKYSISTSLDGTHKLKFTKTDSSSVGDDSNGSLCTERLKNTSPVLKSIIQWGQILIPALVIILTSFDIGKIVITGNVEEELPKRKQTIINRAIILVVFLFLPLLVKVLLKLVKTSGSNIAKNIDCLFDSSATAGTGSVSKPGKTNNSKNGITAVEK